MLLAFIRDDQGVNTVGNGIGHDLKMVLDGGEGANLNAYYQSDLDTYRSGRVIFPMSDITAGPHELDLKAWDVHTTTARLLPFPSLWWRSWRCSSMAC